MLGKGAWSCIFPRMALLIGDVVRKAALAAPTTAAATLGDGVLTFS